MLDLIRKLFDFMQPSARLTLVLLSIPLLVSTALEMLSVGMVLPVVQLIVSGDSPWLAPVRAFLPVEQKDLLLSTVVVFCLLFFAKNVFILWMTWLINRFTNRQMAQFLQLMYGLYLRQPYTFHLNRHSADIQRNLSYSAPTAFDGLRMALNALMEGMLILGVFVLLLLIEPIITLGSAAVIGLISAFYLQVLGPIVRRWGTYSHDIQAGMLRHILGSLSTVREIKLLGVGKHMSVVYKEITDRLAHYLTLSLTTQHLPRLILETTIVIGGLGLLLVLLYARGEIEELFAVTSLFGMAALRLLPSANRILQYATELRHRTAPIDALHDDLIQGRANAEAEDSVSVTPLPFQHEVSLVDLSFSYETGMAAAIHDINLVISRGETVGLVGPSGAGKSTLADILLGFLRPSQGTIKSDGHDIYADLPAWKSNLAYVPQQISLLDDTARRNIAFGIPDSDIDEDAVIRAIRLAHLEPVIQGLPDGLDTVLGEQGVRLSGGQRQRIGIARALYRNPLMLVLDEATSALDNESEEAISQTVAELAGVCSVIIIAHRLSTVRKCNRIVFMQGGCIVAQGPFDELTKNCGPFRRLVELGDLSSQAA